MIIKDYEFPDSKTLTKDEYVLYVIQDLRNKYDLTWKDIADTINEHFYDDYDESTYRKKFSKHVKQDLHKDDNLVDSNDLLYEIRKERFKLRDEVTQTNSNLRRLAREETCKEIAHDFAEQMNSKKLLPVSKIEDVEIKIPTKEAIVQLSDWHYGIEINSYFNQYNKEIAKQRISNLCEKVIEECLKENIQRIRIVNLSDLIAGRIHLTIRLQSRIDVITQTMEVAEILAEFIHRLSNYFQVYYYSCSDNHSRVEPNKKESLELESFYRIIDWYLPERLQAQVISGQVKFFNNEISDDIISFKIGNHKICGVHGHNDQPSKIIANLSLMTEEHYDLILTAHYHHFSANEQNKTILLSNGTLMGTDSYSEKLRLTSAPSQNLIFVSKENVIESIKRLVL